MKKGFAAFASILFITVLVACNLPAGGTGTGTGPDEIATTVAQTFEAMTVSAPQTPLDTPTLPPTQSQAPSLTPTSTLTLTPAITSTPEPGSIIGDVKNYSYGAIPVLKIIAFNQDTSYLMWWSWKNGEGMTSYAMNGYIPPAHYQVVAYDAAGHAGGCTTIIEVKSNQTVRCDITNWGGSYPVNPSPNFAVP
jgi:hypothetical protein